MLQGLQPILAELQPELHLLLFAEALSLFWVVPFVLLENFNLLGATQLEESLIVLLVLPLDQLHVFSEVLGLSIELV